MKSCFFMTVPRVCVVYVHVMNHPGFAIAAHRFIESYQKHPPQFDHETIVACNLGWHTGATERVFGNLPNVTYYDHDNSGYDIGAFQTVCRNLRCDLMVCLGSGVYFRHTGWLRRIMEAYEAHGPGLYGAMGNGGNPRVGATPHIRTVAFWLPPELLRAYPIKVTRPEQRYPFEHGPNSLSKWIWSKGLECWMVCRSGEYTLPAWNSIPNGFQRGDQSDLIIGDRLCDPPYGPG